MIYVVIVLLVDNDGNCPKSSNELLVGGVEKSEVDDGCFNAFDLNVVAPGIPESSSDEKLAGCNAEDCGGGEKSGIDSVELDDTHKVEGLPTPMEITDDKVQSSSPVVCNSEECMIPDHPGPSCDDKSIVQPCSPNVVPTPEIDPDYSETAVVENASKEVTLNPDLNMMEVEDNGSGYNTSSHPTLVDHEKGGDGSSEPTLVPAPCGANGGEACVEEKLGPKSEIREPSMPKPQSATDVSSMGSPVDVVESMEQSETTESHVVCRRLSSESSCNTSSAVGEKSRTTSGLFLATGVPKIGSN